MPKECLSPVSLEDQLMPGTLEFAIHTLVETRMDTSFFDGRHNNDETGSPAYDPKILLKVLLLAYSRRTISSRKIERACRDNAIFMALSCKQSPDHSTIAGFVSSMKGEILPLFRDVLLVCEEINLLGKREIPPWKALIGGLPLLVWLASNPFTFAIASLLHHRQPPPLFPPEQSPPPAPLSSNRRYSRAGFLIQLLQDEQSTYRDKWFWLHPAE
jgi:transposase